MNRIMHIMENAMIAQERILAIMLTELKFSLALICDISILTLYVSLANDSNSLILFKSLNWTEMNEPCGSV